MSDSPARRAALSRADLVAALAVGDTAAAHFIGERVGLRRTEVPAGPADPAALPEPADRPGPTASQAVSPTAAVAPQDYFWLPASMVYLDPETPTTTEPQTAPAPYNGWRTPPPHPPLFQPLTTWADLVPRLRRVLCDHREGRGIDLERTVQHISRGRILAQFPRERRRRWGPALLLLEDDSRRLIPYRLDRRLVRRALRRLVPAHAFGRALVGEGAPLPSPAPDSAIPWPPPPGTLVLALGDVGSLAVAGAALRADWLALGRQLEDAGCRPLVLFPGSLDRCPADLAAVWRPVPWERPRVQDGATPRARAERLLRLVAPAARIEPGLLRAARLLLPPAQADAATEADLWQHQALAGDSAAGASIDLEQARALRDAFAAREPLDLRRRLLRLVRDWRRDLPPEVWFDELLNADPEARETGPDTPDLADLGADLADARAYFHAFCQEVAADLNGLPAHDRDWLERIRVRSTGHLWGDPVVGLDLATRANELVRGRPDAPPDGIRPGQVAAGGRPEGRWRLLQDGDALVAVAVGSAAEVGGSPVAEVVSADGRLEVVDERNPGFWEGGAPPAWASDWGWDEYGAWVEFAVSGADGWAETQRMRWIVPGPFLMGPPAGEPGRRAGEGPQHEVFLTEGFWLFDTPCTQALWMAVMGENPSRFKDPQRPVETVDWQDAQQFMAALNRRLPGLALSLPSEAQWEYACRAGTDTALYSGPIAILGDLNAPALDPIAWYGGNSGVDYDLDKAHDTSQWPKMQYPTKRAGTRQVKGKAPNAWGLYDSLGNVREWVEDHWHRGYRGAPINGSAWLGAPDGGRVVRGGSWKNHARDCRCAYRDRAGPAHRYDFLGFRCARVQGREAGQEGAGRGPAAGPAAARPA